MASSGGVSAEAVMSGSDIVAYKAQDVLDIARSCWVMQDLGAGPEVRYPDGTQEPLVYCGIGCTYDPKRYTDLAVLTAGQRCSRKGLGLREEEG